MTHFPYKPKTILLIRMPFVKRASIIHSEIMSSPKPPIQNISKIGSEYLPLQASCMCAVGLQPISIVYINDTRQGHCESVTVLSYQKGANCQYSHH